MRLCRTLLLAGALAGLTSTSAGIGGAYAAGSGGGGGGGSMPSASGPQYDAGAEWAAQVDHVIRTVGADHVAFGLDAVAGRSAVPRDAAAFGDMVAALNKITTPENVRKITGENWLRVLEKAKAV